MKPRNHNVICGAGVPPAQRFMARTAPSPRRSASGTLAPPFERRGFTLVEALATLVLVAIILPPAMHGISLATSTASQALRRMEAAALAEAKLAELVVTGEWQSPELSGDWEPEMPGYSWEAAVEDWEDDRVRLLTVRVEYVVRGMAREVALTTLVYPGFY